MSGLAPVGFYETAEGKQLLAKMKWEAIVGAVLVIVCVWFLITYRVS